MNFDYAFLQDKPISYCKFLFETSQRYEKLKNFNNLNATSIAISANLGEEAHNSIRALQRELYITEEEYELHYTEQENKSEFAEIKVGEKVDIDKFIKF